MTTLCGGGIVYLLMSIYIFIYFLLLGGCRTVASGPGGPILAGPGFAQETDFLKFTAGHFANFFTLGGGGGRL